MILGKTAFMAPWFCLHPPSCCPGFESQAHHLRFFNLHCWNWNCICYWNEKRTKINGKRGRDWPILKMNFVNCKISFLQSRFIVSSLFCSYLVTFEKCPPLPPLSLPIFFTAIDRINKAWRRRRRRRTKNSQSDLFRFKSKVRRLRNH